MLTIVIPTLNEAHALPGTLVHTRRAASDGADLEIIVSDCASRDGTADVARRCGADRVLTGGTCRADALNRGAAVASGDVLLFHHADSILPTRFDQIIERALRRGGASTVGGAFDFQFARRPRPPAWPRQCLKLVVTVNRIRFRCTGNFYGDQSIFVRGDVFGRCGGFPCIPLMEDARFSARMRRFGRTVILRPPVVTSPRRFLARGVVRQFAQDLVMLSCESVGVRPDALWSRYNHFNRDYVCT